MKPTVYIETTIVSYLTAWPSRDVVRLSHQVLTRQWWVDSKHHFDLFISDVVIQEASAGDATAAAERLKVLAEIRRVPVNETSLQLAEQLVTALSLPSRARLDAAHIAVAAVHGIGFLLTWNCTHLANGMLAAKIDRTCAAAGVTAGAHFDSRTPKGAAAMIDYDKPDDDPIVAEVRQAREQYAARFNFDLRAIFADLQRQQINSGEKYVSLPPHRPPGWTEPAKKVG